MNSENVFVIRGSKMKAIQLLVISIALVTLGVFLILKGNIWGWVCSIFFSLAIPVAVLQLFRKSYIRLDTEGFEVNSGLKPWRLNWNDVESFYVGKIHGNKIIGINFSDTYNEMVTGREISSTLSGMEGAINNQFKMKPELICEHLNNWKAIHLKQNDI